MQHQELIASLGFDVVTAPSGKYARLERQGRTIAWAIPLGYCYGGERWTSFYATEQEVHDRMADARPGVDYVIEHREVDDRWAARYTNPCGSSCHIRLDMRRDLHDLEPLERRHAEWSRMRRWVGAGRNTQVRVSGDPRTRDEARSYLEWAAGLPRQARRQAMQAVRAGMARLGLARRYGIEIEFGGHAHEVRRAMETANLPGWQLKGDGSLRIRGYSGLEIASPPLAGDEGIEQLKRVCEVLNACDTKVNKTCGLHVHIDAAELRMAGVKKLARAWFNNQRLINWLVSPSRRNNGFCRPISAQEITNIEAARGSLRSAVNVHYRYRNMNLASIIRHGTVEFRLHQGTMDAAKIEAWVRFLEAFVDHALDATAPVEPKQGLRSMLMDARLDDETINYMLRRARQFHAPEEVLAQ